MMKKTIDLPPDAWAAVAALAEARGVTIETLAAEAFERLLREAQAPLSADQPKAERSAPQKKRKFFPRPRRRAAADHREIS